MNSNGESRQERRQKRLEKKQQKMTQHGKSIARIFKNAVLKRLKGKGDSKDQTNP